MNTMAPSAQARKNPPSVGNRRRIVSITPVRAAASRNAAGWMPMATATISPACKPLANPPGSPALGKSRNAASISISSSAISCRPRWAALINCGSSASSIVKKPACRLPSRSGMTRRSNCRNASNAAIPRQTTAGRVWKMPYPRPERRRPAPRDRESLWHAGHVDTGQRTVRSR